jgi:hypothetical protein
MMRTAQPAVEGAIEADPVAVCVRKLMAERGNWVGTASDFLRTATTVAGDDVSKKTAGRRAQTFPRVLGIEISFSREGEQEREPSG